MDVIGIYLKSVMMKRRFCCWSAKVRTTISDSKWTAKFSAVTKAATPSSEYMVVEASATSMPPSAMSSIVSIEITWRLPVVVGFFVSSPVTCAVFFRHPPTQLRQNASHFPLPQHGFARGHIVRRQLDPSSLPEQRTECKRMELLPSASSFD
ncbi:hypothetical protein OUZ56_028121 [Daphnia magna]|uniref:Uncharacterized protein n=1 Tax=Daphnia magna TaxID=35525 RepID=A0ABR0B2X8_9CRUS|nr:hypothetical protein OUZ56_028121 [Daphnia magna]